MGEAEDKAKAIIEEAEEKAKKILSDVKDVHGKVEAELDPLVHRLETSPWTGLIIVGMALAFLVGGYALCSFVHIDFKMANPAPVVQVEDARD